MTNQNEIKTEVDLLKKEAELNNAPLKDIEQTRYKNFYEVLHEILHLKKHENKVMECGTIISDSDSFWLKNGFTVFPAYAESVSDGKSVFYYLQPTYDKLSESKNIIVFQDNKSYMELMGISRKSESIIITKDEIRTLVYYGFNVTSIEDRHWTSYTDALSKEKQKEIANYLDTVSKDDLEKIFNYLNYAEFELSLDKIGTTIVYYLDNEIMSKQTDKESEIPFDFDNKAHKTILKNYLNTHDGAILAKGNGIFREQVRLNPKGNNVDPNHAGTRHNSALNFAYENHNTVVICISEDGPITLYYKDKEPYEFQFSYKQNATSNKSSNIPDSSKILCFMNSKPKVEGHTLIIDSKDETEDPFEYDFSGLRSLAEERGDIFDEDWSSETCSNCKNTYNIKITRISGWNDREEYSCPYCHKEFYKHCFDVQVRKSRGKVNKNDR
ncbi:DNA integrity scanning protein DisA nucleotide-binding domain protein [Treponema sp.]|uniref:DNA integrity scanning protein DisA nucleotide-binding domain protein n=1 Tax=Treponema sp. TaxID=166 RepID=UPI00298D7682|nr:DNA integrity scanning protein DisA nucleotide-binding domain protein [Treponema sp.]MCQ2240919.1 DNA integrity scanning protein DisA nucleotide-binding domain protein [Treponema sp.]